MAGRIPDHVFDQIRQATDIVELISSYVPLKRAGSNFRALCPFHKEKTPSFNVHPQKQIFHCFGCGVGGDVFRFVMLTESLTFIEAVRFLAQRAGIEIPEEKSGAAPAPSHKEALLKLHEDVCCIYQKILESDPRGELARAYLQKRQVSDQSVKQFRLGFALDAWDNVLKWATNKGITTDILELSGLVTRNEKGHLYDRFRGRLMFPICDEQGRVVGFSGRLLEADAKEAKYVNSPETPIFKKGQMLYGLDKSKRALLDSRKAIVCEGQLDLIACHEAGVLNVVASQGTAFTERHGRLLKRYVDEVILMFDSDTAGQSAATRSVDALLEAGLSVAVAMVPAGHDPDSLVRSQGADALKTVVQDARAFLDFYLDYLCQKHSLETDTGRTEIARSMAEMLAKIPNAAMSFPYLVKAARRLKVPESVISAEIRKLSGRRQISSEENGIGVEDYLVSAKKVSTADRELLHLILAEPHWAAKAAQEVNPDWLPAGPIRPILLKIFALCESGQWRGTESLQDELTDAEHGAILSELMLREPSHPDRAAAVHESIAALQQEFYGAEREAIQTRLAEPGLSDEEIAKLQKRLTDLRQKPFDLRSQDKHITRLLPR